MSKEVKPNKRPHSEKDYIEGIDIQIQRALKYGLAPGSLLAFLQIVQHNIIHQMVDQVTQNEAKEDERIRKG
jgi:hypothetical protein